jgi:hypothetical protein
MGPEAGAAPARHRSLPARRRGLYWVGVLAALAALVGGGYVTITAWVSESAPETAAVAYFRALARGDAAAALGLGDVPPGVRTYLTGDVLRASLKVARISNVRVLSADRAGDSARVTLQYQLNYAHAVPVTVADAVLTVRRGRNWRLTRTAVPVRLQIESGSARMSVAGAAVPTDTVLLLPGALPISLDTPNLDLGQLVVHLNGAVPNQVQPKISEAGRQAIGTAVAAAMRACIGGGQVPGSCPPPADALAIPGSVHGTIVGDLADQLNVSVESDVNGLLDVNGTVDVKGTYQRLDFDNLPVPKSGTVELKINAHCYATDPGKIMWAG